VVFRAEGEFVGSAADWRGDGASDDGAGYVEVEVVKGEFKSGRVYE
jgi:hypothetical protein